MMKKYTLIAAIIMFSGLGFIISNFIWKDTETPTLQMRGNPIADFTDKRLLAGFADHLFIGKVVSRSGQVEQHFPITQSNVEVFEVIKGNLEPGITVISQYGGYVTEEGKEHLIEVEDDPLLEIGKTYFFIAKVRKME